MALDFAVKMRTLVFQNAFYFVCFSTNHFGKLILIKISDIFPRFSIFIFPAYIYNFRKGDYYFHLSTKIKRDLYFWKISTHF